LKKTFLKLLGNGGNGGILVKSGGRPDKAGCMMKEPIITETSALSSVSMQTVPSSSGQPRFDPLERLVLLQPPARVETPLSWAGHIPFAMLLMDLVRPRLLVELGTHSGNSYNAFCQAVDSLKLTARCYAVDTWKGDRQAGHYDSQVYDCLRAYQESRYGHFSTLLKMTFDEAVSRFEPNSIDLLHIDGLHTYEAVRHDFETWQPKLSDQAVVLFHDTTVHQADFGVWKFWRELQSCYPSLEFPHCYGLGVLAVGRYTPPSLLNLINLEGPARRGFFALVERLGNGVIFEHRLQERDHDAKRLEAALGDRERALQAAFADRERALQEREGSIQRVASLTQQLSERETEMQKLEDQIDGLGSELQRKQHEVETHFQRLVAAETSLAEVFVSSSWRLTRPLRVAADIFRRTTHLAVDAIYRLYIFLPISIRLRLRPLLHPLASRIQAWYVRGVPSSVARLPFNK
jgi:Methyltransferase domain